MKLYKFKTILSLSRLILNRVISLFLKNDEW